MFQAIMSYVGVNQQGCQYIYGCGYKLHLFLGTNSLWFKIKVKTNRHPINANGPLLSFFLIGEVSECQKRAERFESTRQI